MTQSIQELVAAYRATAAAWDRVQDDAKKANPLFKELHALYKLLRSDEVGRTALTDLMHDRTVGTGVRLLAASHSLAWDPVNGVGVLEAIERDGPGLYRTTARYTLKSFREGTLDMDW